MEEVNTALKFIIIPTETIKGISISFVEKTIALGGVANWHHKCAAGS